MELLSESWGRGLGRVLFRVAQSSTISSVVLGLLALSCKGQRNKRWWLFPRLITDGVLLVMASSMSRLGGLLCIHQPWEHNSRKWTEGTLPSRRDSNRKDFLGRGFHC